MDKSNMTLFDEEALPDDLVDAVIEHMENEQEMQSDLLSEHHLDLMISEEHEVDGYLTFG